LFEGAKIDVFFERRVFINILFALSETLQEINYQAHTPNADPQYEGYYLFHADSFHAIFYD
jgi:hypothetical protein